jgi:arylsulfatase A-like enzyme
MYWAPGAVHGPHHVFKEWADKYKGKFDEGWDAYREPELSKVYCPHCRQPHQMAGIEYWLDTSQPEAAQDEAAKAA